MSAIPKQNKKAPHKSLAQSASLASPSSPRCTIHQACTRCSPSFRRHFSTCIFHDLLAMLNKPNNSLPTHSSEEKLWLASQCDNFQLVEEANASPQLSQNKAGVQKEGGWSCVVPQASFCVYQSLHGADVFLNSSSLLELTGLSLFMPFALITWAGISVGVKVAAIPRVAKRHSGVHWWEGLNARTQGGKATSSLKGTTKRENM